jgi:hypothetical protein
VVVTIMTTLVMPVLSAAVGRRPAEHELGM